MSSSVVITKTYEERKINRQKEFLTEFSDLIIIGRKGDVSWDLEWKLMNYITIYNGSLE